MMIHNHKIFLGLDLDGVIIDHTKSKLRLAKRFGWNLRPDETPSEIIKTIVPRPILQEMQHYLYHDTKISLSSPIMTGARMALSKIRRIKVPYALISRRKDPELAIKLLKFLKLWPFYLNKKNSFFVIERSDKNQKAKKLGVTHYIDDEIGCLDELISVKHRILFDKFDVFKNANQYMRIKSWNELLKSLPGLKC